MAQPGRAAVIAVHGVADQQPGQTVRELARLLCRAPPGYRDGEAHDVIVSVRPLASVRESDAGQTGDGDAALPDASMFAGGAPGRPSNFFVAERSATQPGAAQPIDDLGVRLTDHLLARYQPAERDSLYESTRISLRPRSNGPDAA